MLRSHSNNRTPNERESKIGTRTQIAPLCPAAPPFPARSTRPSTEMEGLIHLKLALSPWTPWTVSTALTAQLQRRYRLEEWGHVPKRDVDPVCGLCSRPLRVDQRTVLPQHIPDRRLLWPTGIRILRISHLCCNCSSAAPFLGRCRDQVDGWAAGPLDSASRGMGPRSDCRPDCLARCVCATVQRFT